ncbi:MAG: HPF/RaiA family ribosome-associated protein [Sterolibacterium sp.]
MQVQINTDHSVELNAALATHVHGVVTKALSRLSDHITRVEVHLNDESSHKITPNDKRCAMEARLEGRQPLTVTQQAATFHEAIDGAASKLSRRIQSKVGRLRDQRIRAPAVSHLEQPATVGAD